MNTNPPKDSRRETIRSMTAPICDSSRDPVFSSFLGAVKQQTHDGVGHDHVAKGAGVKTVDGPEATRINLIGMGQVKKCDIARLTQAPAHGGLRIDAAFDVAAQRTRQDRAAMRLSGAEQHHLAGLVPGRVQHRRDIGSLLTNRTPGKHIVAAHTYDQRIRPVVDIANHPVTHSPCGRAELVDRAPSHRPTGALGHTRG